jgi:hypothetical protein
LPYFALPISLFCVNIFLLLLAAVGNCFSSKRKTSSIRTVRRKTAPDFLVENMIDLDKQFLNPAPKTPAVRGGRRKKAK